MFGMLDYRAHKLLWLLLLPVKIIFRLLFFIIIFASVFIASLATKIYIFKIIVAFFVMKIASFIFINMFAYFLDALIKKIFFWIIDIIPAYGTNHDEAIAVVLLGGDLFKLTKKFDTQIENWTNNDTVSFVSLAFNWRQKIFFNPRSRFEQVVPILQKIHRETGKEPMTIGLSRLESIRESVNGGHVTWLEYAIVSPIFNDILGFILICIIALYQM